MRRQEEQPISHSWHTAAPAPPLSRRQQGIKQPSGLCLSWSHSLCNKIPIRNLLGLSISPIGLSSDVYYCIYCTMDDVLQRRRAQEEIAHAVMRGAKTGMPALYRR